MKSQGKKKVFVAMSGGVDSSVAAALLKKQRFDVVGIYMKGWSLTRCAEEDAADARRVAEKLRIPFYVFNFENEYKKTVVDYMVSEYATGRTPNPDVMCNREIKFGIFLKKSLQLGADYIATGHYVKLVKKSDFVNLAIAKDVNKDQSYFLWTLTQNQLKHCLFPIGEYIKPQIRKLAKKYHLPTAEKPDSQGVCFIGEINVAEFLKEKLGINPGPILTLAGKKVGIHDGLSFYTIGQRRGIGSTGGGIPYYVVSKNAEKNALIVVEAENDALFSKELSVKDINWILGKQPKFPLKCLARIRYRQPLEKATLFELPISTILRRSFGSRIIKNSKSKILKVIFNKSQRAVTPGQSAVFYTTKGEMLSGGIIE